MINKIQDLKIAVIGLGYVGLPLAIEFNKKYSVFGFDIDKNRIKELKDGYDRTSEIRGEDRQNLNQLSVTSVLEDIKECDVYIITVPTPVDKKNKPDLEPIKSASKMVASLVSVNNVVIYESTVYPGCTEQICIPILEQYSKKVYNRDFFCGYSPERINPGDTEHTLTKIKKITSGGNEGTANFIDGLYSSIIVAGTHKVSSIAVAEAAKIIENTQRDVNIALVNELSIIFDRMDLDTTEILEAAGTKWNFLPFKPGLVGGHCIGVDPYYLTFKANELGYDPEIILAGRRINDHMGHFLVEKIISQLEKSGVTPKKAKIAILGLTFKENCPDLRNTKVITILEQLEKIYDCKVSVSDSCANKIEAKELFGINLVELNKIKDQDGIIIAVGHNQYRDLTIDNWKKMLKYNGLVVDVKSIINKEKFSDTDIRYWRL